MTSGNNQATLLQQSQPLQVNTFGKTLVVAPHQDDESLGCGGIIALLRQMQIPVEVIFVSDGSMSHPASREYPSEKLVALREREALAALEMLNVLNDCVHLMRLKDSQVPHSNYANFPEAVQSFFNKLIQIKPATILVPWRRDPHKDHRASWQIVQSALELFNQPVRQLEYLIWLWERGNEDEFPNTSEAKLWRIDITNVNTLKQQAIMAHVSQTTRLINDDSNGFILSPEVLSHFKNNYEIFAEVY